MTEADQPEPPQEAAPGAPSPELPAPPSEPEKVKCSACGRLVDVEDITTARGKFYCSNCVVDAVSIETFMPFREKYDNRAIRWTVLGCGLLILLVVFGSVFLLVYTYMRLSPEIECKNLHVARISRALMSYASTCNAYPPDNNDLRVLYTEGYKVTFVNFVCPGTKNVVTALRHLKDSSASPVGDGMSYFYQGGYGFFEEKGDDKRPLLWDQSAANHRGTGVNIVYKDGHQAWDARVPELHPPGQEAPEKGGPGQDGGPSARID
jgi:hypothetical protein